jgi:APA family basic amino acid/polyamine antiporter
VWDSSPHKTWRFLGLPVVVWGALVDLVYLLIVLYFFITQNAATASFALPSVIVFIGVWVLGVGWYFIWKQRSKSVGVDVSMTYGELPPE